MQKFGNVEINYYLCIAFRPKTDVRICFYLGEMVEWSITTVLKTVVQRCTGVRIPLSPLKRLYKISKSTHKIS